MDNDATERIAQARRDNVSRTLFIAADDLKNISYYVFSIDI